MDNKLVGEPFVAPFAPAEPFVLVEPFEEVDSVDIVASFEPVASAASAWKPFPSVAWESSAASVALVAAWLYPFVALAAALLHPFVALESCADFQTDLDTSILVAMVERVGSLDSPVDLEVDSSFVDLEVDSSFVDLEVDSSFVDLEVDSSSVD